MDRFSPGHHFAGLRKCRKKLPGSNSFRLNRNESCYFDAIKKESSSKFGKFQQIKTA